MLEIIDVGGLRSGDPAAVARVATQLGRACRDTGFFYVSNHGIPESLLAGIFESARMFFAQPAAAKDAISIKRSPHNRGYVGLATESLDPTHTDHKEAFNVGLDLAPSDPEVVAGKPFRGVNLWPDTPGFRDTALSYFDAVCGSVAICISRSRPTLVSRAIISPTSSTARWRHCGCCTIRRAISHARTCSGRERTPTMAASRCS